MTKTAHYRAIVTMLFVAMSLIVFECGEDPAPPPPATSAVVTTGGITDINPGGASAKGIIVSDGGDPVTARGICWGTSAQPTTSGSKTAESGGVEFTSQLSGLTPNTVYYVRAYAINSIATSYGEERIFKTYTSQVTDVDGNTYYTVTIGDQEWMAENLKVTKFRNGDLVANISDNAAWQTATTPGYCDYDNLESNSSKYGRLYNGFAATDARNIAPVGWHVPSDAEWTTLTNHLTSNGMGFEGSGNDIGKSLASSSLWVSAFPGFPTATAGMIGNDRNSNNRSGFTALPGGVRFIGPEGNFHGITGRAAWWSTTLTREIGYLDAIVRTENYFQQTGQAIRCVKD